MTLIAAIIWKPCAPMPQPRAGYAAGVLSSRIIFAGGSSWEGDTKVRTSRVDAFDPECNCWASLPSLPISLSDAAFVTVGNSLFVLGGSDGTNVLDEVYSFNGISWNVRPDLRLPEPRVYGAAVTDGQRILILEGLQKQDDYRSALHSIWSIDSEQPGEGWTRLPDCPCNTRIAAGVVMLRNKIVLLGGLDAKPESPSNLSDIWSLDLSTNHWNHEGELPEGRRAMGVSAVGDDLYIFGGYTDKFRSDILKWSRGSFTQVGALPEAVAAAPFIHVGSKWYITGGETGVHLRGAHTWSGALSELKSEGLIKK